MLHMPFLSLSLFLYVCASLLGCVALAAHLRLKVLAGGVGDFARSPLFLLQARFFCLGRLYVAFLQETRSHACV
jgi:hypothetical protein